MSGFIEIQSVTITVISLIAGYQTRTDVEDWHSGAWEVVMSGKLGFMLKRFVKLANRHCGRRSPRTKRLWKKYQKYAEQSWDYSQRTADVAFMDGPDRAGK